MVRRVHREFAVRAGRARGRCCCRPTHPVAFAGFFAHTGALDEPYERLARTARVMDAIIFGPRAEADRLTRRVRAMHRRVRGDAARAGRALPGRARPTPPTTPSCCCGSSPRSSTRRCSSTTSTCGALSRDERDAYWQDYRVVGRCSGCCPRRCRRTIEDFDAYMAAMLAAGDLHVTDRGARAGDRDRPAPAGAAATRARCSSSSTRSPSGCCRARSGAVRLRGTRPARSRCTAGRSTCGG